MFLFVFSDMFFLNAPGFLLAWYISEQDSCKKPKPFIYPIQMVHLFPHPA